MTKDRLKNVPQGKKILSYIHSNLLNSSVYIHAPFGDRKVVYCDYTASGLSLKFFEEFIINEVLPEYANVHSFLAGMSCQTTSLRNDAKTLIKQAVNATDQDALIFVGNGTTGAIHKLIHNINLSEPPIVFVGPFEHHSNLLPWRHLAQKVIRLKTNTDGAVSMSYLEEALKAESKNAKKLGCQMLVCLSAASNVTGILVDTNAASSLVHRYGGIIFWDYATAAPYVEINMNPHSKNNAENPNKDAVFFSVHKFVGGPQTPGILVAKKKLFEAGEKFPFQSGGGTVNFVRRKHTSYLKNVEDREEGGTPAIVESIRAGMVIQLKEAIGATLIKKREEELVDWAWTRFSQCPNIVVLGGSKAPRIAIFSFLIRHTRTAFARNQAINKTVSNSQSAPEEDNCVFIHHDFICALLNDLFGIQSRSGCACAGPYALDLLGINETLASNYEDALLSKDNEEILEHKVLRPGFTRINLPFFYPDEEINFIIDALTFVAKYAWTFLPFYELNPSTGQWRYCNDKRSDMGKHLSNISYERGVMRWNKPTVKSAGAAPSSFKECMSTAKTLQQSLTTVLRQSTCKVANAKMDKYWLRSKMNYLRWFLLSSEAAADARGFERPVALYPNTGSPWHPGCIERCFCPDLAKRTNESLSRLCEYTNFKMTPSGPEPKHAGDRCTHRAAYTAANPGVSKDGLESKSVTDVICVRRPATSSEQGEEPFSGSRGAGIRYGGGGRQRSNGRSIQREGYQQFQPRGMFQKRGSVAAAGGGSGGGVYGRPGSPYGEVGWPVLPQPILKSSTQHMKSSLHINESDSSGYSDEQAIRLFSMIQPNDRLLLHLSGGKSSMALLHCLHAYQENLRKLGGDGSITKRPSETSAAVSTHDASEDNTAHTGVFEMAAVVVDLAYDGYDLLPLVNYLKALGVTLFYEKQNLSNFCSHSVDLCSSLKQKVIYNVAKMHGYNVLALPHNLDDMAATFLSSVFHNGTIQTMEANVELPDLNIRLIRPLVYCREKTITDFIEKANLPVMKTVCPICEQSNVEQTRLKEMLIAEEGNNPNLFSSIISAISPLFHLSSHSNMVLEPANPSEPTTGASWSGQNK